MGRTGLILRQWVERDGCIVTAYQSESYDLPTVTTAVTDRLMVFKFPNEWRAILCEARMSTYNCKMRKIYWRRYFDKHVNPPSPIIRFRVIHPDNISLWLLVLFFILGILLCK